jgi:hypothetical protein
MTALSNSSNEEGERSAVGERRVSITKVNIVFPPLKRMSG